MITGVRIAFVAGLLAAAAFPLTVQMNASAQSGGSGGGASGGGGSGGANASGGSGANTQGGNTGGAMQGGSGATTGAEGGAGTQRTMPGANTSGTPVNRNRNETTTQGTRPSSQLSRVNSQDYLDQIASSDMFEVASSQLALERSSNANVQAFARKMVSDHQHATQRVTQALSNSGSNNLRPPAQMTAEHQRMLERLRAAERGAAFDRLYLDMQVRGHEHALALHRAYGNTGDNLALQNVAKEMAPVVQQHLVEVRRLSGNRTESRKGGERRSGGS